VILLFALVLSQNPNLPIVIDLPSVDRWTPNWKSIPFDAPTTVQAIAQATPISIMSTRKVLGKGRSVGLWKISICSRNGAVTLPAEQVLMGSTIPFIPNVLAEDIVGRQVSTSPVSVISANGNTALSLATTVVAGIGIAAKSPNTLYASAAASVAQLFINLATQQAPNATPYFSSLLPSTVAFNAQNACGTWYLFSSPIKNAKVEMWEVR
jgi:hypothetical protein